VSQTSHDARAIVRAVADLTTQVRRLADALTTSADAPTTTPDDGARIAQRTPEPPGAAEHRARVAAWITRGTRDLPIPDQAPAVDEDAQRTTRRDSIRNLLDRIDRYVVWTPDETALLRRHVETEIREADTARAVAAGNKRHVQTIVPEIDRLAAELEAADRVRAERVRHVAALIEAGAPWTANQHETARRIRAALDAEPGTEH
jgi:hypothetical protein